MKMANGEKIYIAFGMKERVRFPASERHLNEMSNKVVERVL